MSEQNPEENDNNMPDDQNEPLRKKIRADKRRRTREDLWKDLRGQMYPDWEHMCEEDKETLETNFEVNYFIALGNNKSIPSTATSDTNDTSENNDMAEASTSGSSSQVGTSSEAGTSNEPGTSSMIEGPNFVDSDSGTSSSGIGSGSNSDSFHNTSDIGGASVSRRSSFDEPCSSGAASSNEPVSYSRANSPDAARSSIEGEFFDINAPSTSAASSSQSNSRRSRCYVRPRPRVTANLQALLSATPTTMYPGEKPYQPFQGDVLQPISHLANCFYYPPDPLPSFSSFQRGSLYDPQPSTSYRDPQPFPQRPVPITGIPRMPINDGSDDDNNNSDEIDPIQLAIHESFQF